MQTSERRHLDTVVLLQTFDVEDRLCGGGTGFLCHARHYHHRTRTLLFLVTNAHVVEHAGQRIDVLFRSGGTEEAFIHSVTARTGAGPGTWFTSGSRDLAALLLDPAQIPDEIQARSFDVETDTLSIRELRRLGIAEGAEGRLVGFVERASGKCAEYPAFRSVTLAEIPRRWGFVTPLLVEGTMFPGNSGSPVILKPEPGFGSRPKTDPDGKLIGITYAIGPRGGVDLSHGAGAPIRIEETATLVHLVPVGALRQLLHHAVGQTILAETFGPMARRVKGWLRRKKKA